MTQEKDGGPAFPYVTQEKRAGSAVIYQNITPGMSLWDWYAAHALAQASRDIWENHKPEDVAKRCGMFADAMLAEKEKRS
ncbi:hypothetical protein [Parasphingopyxis sp.]|uniref:hypothetical protein n=1 Tax=Parasphingopyxis sp. TaxID=1920299 RepID=UPI00260CA9B8|nr:hypothetical protein [Parasphingopyxis sp.]